MNKKALRYWQRAGEMEEGAGYGYIHNDKTIHKQNQKFLFFYFFNIFCQVDILDSYGLGLDPKLG